MPTPRAMPRYERTVGGAITESSRPLSAVVASKGTGARTVRIASSQSHAVKHTSDWNLRSQGRNHASGLERRIHGPGTLPSNLVATRSRP
jgi:hypothetical protein